VLIGRKTHTTDTGSPEVQVAILSERITHLTEHFKTHAKITTPPRPACQGHGAGCRLPEEQVRFKHADHQKSSVSAKFNGGAPS
jgi:hypothetical protein